MAIAVPNFSVDSQRGLAEMLWDWDPLLSASHVKVLSASSATKAWSKQEQKCTKSVFYPLHLDITKNLVAKYYSWSFAKLQNLPQQKAMGQDKAMLWITSPPVSLTCTRVLYAFKCGATEDPQFLGPDLISAGLLPLRLAWYVIGCAKHTRCYRIGWLVFQSQVDIKLCSLKICAVRSSRDPLVVGAFHVDAVWWLWLLKKKIYSACIPTGLYMIQLVIMIHEYYVNKVQ